MCIVSARSKYFSGKNFLKVTIRLYNRLILGPTVQSVGEFYIFSIRSIFILLTMLDRIYRSFVFETLGIALEGSIGLGKPFCTIV